MVKTAQAWVGGDAEAEAGVDAAEVEAFIGQLSSFRATLSTTRQGMLDSLVMAALENRTEVEGFDGGSGQGWIFPPGLVDDLSWVRLSRECRVRGGIESVLDPTTSTGGVRLWGCQAPTATGTR